MADEGLESQILDAERFGGAEAVVSTFTKLANKYRTEAQVELDDLNLASETRPALYPVKFEVINDDEVVLKAMARHLLFRDALSRDKWPVHTEPRFSRKVKPFIGTVKNLSSSGRRGLWLDAHKSETIRGEEWLIAVMNAHTHPKIIGSLASRRALEATEAESA
jgi:hypothetical protein